MAVTNTTTPEPQLPTPPEVTAAIELGHNPVTCAHLFTAGIEWCLPTIHILAALDADMGAELVETIPAVVGDVEAAGEILREAGWSVTGPWITVERGYLIADVERVTR